MKKEGGEVQTVFYRILSCSPNNQVILITETMALFGCMFRTTVLFVRGGRLCSKRTTITASNILRWMVCYEEEEEELTMEQSV